jgi:hypothetical protein
MTVQGSDASAKTSDISRSVFAGFWREHQTPFHYTALSLMVVMIAAEALVAVPLRFNGVSQITGCWPSVLLSVALAWYVRWRPLPRAIELSELAIFAIIFSQIMAILIQIAGRSPHPFVDGQLAAIDHSVGFSTVYWVRLIARVWWLRGGLFIAYNLLPILVFSATLVPPFFRDATSSRRFVLGTTVAAILTAIMFWWWPAVGPWTVEGYPPIPEQSAVAAILAHVRSPLPFTADMNGAGIVSLPSFHAVLALMAAFALRRIRGLRIFAFTLCGLIVVSTISTGWHYGIDVVAAFAVAAASIAAVSWID